LASEEQTMTNKRALAHNPPEFPFTIQTDAPANTLIRLFFTPHDSDVRPPFAWAGLLGCFHNAQMRSHSLPSLDSRTFLTAAN
jgi:hypothetical protein